MNEHLENIKEIRQMMEKSTKFLSLSGLSGLFAGLSAMGGAAYLYMNKINFSNDKNAKGLLEGQYYADIASFKLMLLKVAIVTFITALIFAYYFTFKKAKKNNEKIWNELSKRILTQMSFPLVSGALFSLVLVNHGMVWMAASATLIFYGLALLIASKFTFRDIYYLGLTEVLLGTLSLFINGYSFLFWVLGFGVCHIVYGILMYYKYDK